MICPVSPDSAGTSSFLFLPGGECEHPSTAAPGDLGSCLVHLLRPADTDSLQPPLLSDTFPNRSTVSSHLESQLHVRRQEAARLGLHISVSAHLLCGVTEPDAGRVPEPTIIAHIRKWRMSSPSPTVSSWGRSRVHCKPKSKVLGMLLTGCFISSHSNSHVQTLPSV